MTNQTETPDAEATLEFCAQQSFEAAMTRDDMYELGGRLQKRSDEKNQAIRASLGLLANSSDEILDRTDDDGKAADALFELADAVNAAIESHEQEIEILKTGRVRCMVLAAKHLQRVDTLAANAQ